ncbi:unnamed protein product, partial [Polarella glacialis]
LAPPPPWRTGETNRALFDKYMDREDSELAMPTLGSGIYQSHVYKFHLGLRAAFLAQPSQDWYGLVGDDTYVDVGALLEVLGDRLKGRSPQEMALCVGPPEPVEALVKETAFGMLSQQCYRWYILRHFGGDAETLQAISRGERPDLTERVRVPCQELIKHRTSWLPDFEAKLQLYGAGIFCSNAAVRKLLPHLAGDMVLLPGRLFLPAFWSFLPPADVVMNACMEDLGIEKAALPFLGP